MVVIKLQLGNDIRRVNVTGPLSFKDLNDLAKTLFEANLPQSFQFKYKDDEGDLITVSSDRELEEAFRLYKDQDILRLTLSAPEKTQSNANRNANSHNPTSFFDLLEKLVSENGFIRDLLNNLEVDIFSTPNSPRRRGCGSSEVPQSEVVHNAICDGCDSQIRGIRYKCTTCPDYDLCQNCLHKGIHSEHDKVEILRPARHGCPMRSRPDFPHGPVAHNAICDACESQIRGIRYKCLSCPDFDLCEKCYAIKGVHNPEHKFDTITRPSCPYRRHCGNSSNVNKPTNQSEVIHPATCDGCHQRIKGLRYKCDNCIDYDLCQSCKDKNIHKEHSFTTLSRPMFTPPGWKNPEQKEEPKVIPVSQPKEKEPEIKITSPLMKVEPVVPKVEVVAPKVVPVIPKVEAVVPKVEAVVPKVEVVPSAPKVTPPASPVVPVKQPVSSSPFENKLKQLEEMGFPNRARNIEALVKHNGDMTFVVKDLLDD